MFECCIIIIIMIVISIIITIIISMIIMSIIILIDMKGASPWTHSIEPVAVVSKPVIR